MTNARHRIGIVGSRGFPDPEAVCDFVRRLPPGTTVVSGGAQGVDRWAEAAAKERGLETLIFVPDWDHLGSRAGPIRNEQIVAHADQVVAFWDGRSRGTLNTIVVARYGAVPFTVYGPKGETIVAQLALRAAIEMGVFDGWIRGLRRTGRVVTRGIAENASLAATWQSQTKGRLVHDPRQGWSCRDPEGLEPARLFSSQDDAIGHLVLRFLEEHVPVPPRRN